ncbi:MAG: fasciclin domain-containing protein, partial [Pseudomonadota bacterium]
LKTLAADGDFSILVGLVQRVDGALDAGIADTLNDPSFGSTIFAPTNDAIITAANSLGYPDPDPSGASLYLESAADALTDGQAATLLAQVLLYHVTPSELTQAGLTQGAVLPTLASVDLNVGDGTLIDVDPDNADAVLGSINTVDNGVVISVDQLLLPVDIQVDDVPTEQADIIIGGADDDSFFLLGGDDVFSGLGGNDFADGGNGADLMLGGAGDDFFEGRAGNDRLEGQTGDDNLRGGIGDDTLNGDQGEDSLNGGTGNDFLQGGSGNDTISGNTGDDRLIAGEGDDLLRGGKGDDFFRGEDGEDRIFAGDGDDLAFGGGGRDHMFGGAGDDRLVGGNGGDRIFGNSGDDSMFGGFGFDRIFGRSGDDLGDGDFGNDSIFTGAGDDTLNGDEGDDLLNSGTGNDVNNGGEGNDLIAAGAGDDTITGGSGNDVLSFASAVDGANVVTDFASGEDKVELVGVAEEELISVLFGQGDGNDALLISSLNENWSVLLEDVEELEEDDLSFI